MESISLAHPGSSQNKRCRGWDDFEYVRCFFFFWLFQFDHTLIRFLVRMTFGLFFRFDA